MKQKKNSLDKCTIQKILRSLGWSLLSGTAVFVTVYQQTDNVKISVLGALAAVLAPFLPNSAIQYKKGE